MKQLTPMEVGIPVIDLERMLTFYCTVLGCEEVRRADIDAALSSGLTTSARGYVNVWLKTPKGEVIKLMHPSVPAQQAPRVDYLTERTGIAYLTFYCSDLNAVLEKAEAQGAVLRSDRQLLSGEIGIKLCFFDDPEGNVIELVEPLQQP
ncbi:MAG: VOC family protein [Pseudomonadota bacterium]